MAQDRKSTDRLNPRDLFERIKRHLRLKELGITISKGIFVDIGEKGKSPVFAKTIGLVYEQTNKQEDSVEENSEDRYLVITPPVLSSPYAEFGIDKPYVGTINHDIHGTLEATYIGLKEHFLRNQNENRKPCQIKIAVPVTTNSYLREHWLGLFITMNINAAGEIRVTANIVDSQKNPIARSFAHTRFGYIQQAVKQVFGNDVKVGFKFVGQQGAFNFVDCGYCLQENINAFVKGQPYDPNLKIDKTKDIGDDVLYLPQPIENIGMTIEIKKVGMASNIHLEDWHLPSVESERIVPNPIVEEIQPTHTAKKEGNLRRPEFADERPNGRVEKIQLTHAVEKKDDLGIADFEDNKKLSPAPVQPSTKKINNKLQIVPPPKALNAEELKPILKPIYQFISTNFGASDKVIQAWVTLFHYIENTQDGEKQARLLKILNEFVKAKNLALGLAFLEEGCQDSILGVHRNLTFLPTFFRGSTTSTSFLTDFKEAIGEHIKHKIDKRKDGQSSTLALTRVEVVKTSENKVVDHSVYSSLANFRKQ